MSFPAPQDLKGAVQGTLLYIFVYAALMIPFQSFSKFYLLAEHKKAYAKAKKDGGVIPEKKKNWTLSVKYYNYNDILALAGDRTVGNTLEQSLVFLPLFWIHAIFVDPSKSFMIGLIYSISRAIYPLCWLVSGFSGLIILSTGPGYLITVYLAYEIATKFAFA